MSIRTRRHCAFLTATVLVAAQALLAVHDAAPQSHAHAADCQICLHASALDDALPGAVSIFWPQVDSAHTRPTHVTKATKDRYHTPTARAPPQSLRLIATD